MKEEAEEEECELGINRLPNELLLYILALLDWESTLAAGAVCARWRALALAPCLWENMRLVISMNNYTRICHAALRRVSVHLRRVKLQHFRFYERIREPLLLQCANLTHLEISISRVDRVIFQDLMRWPRLRYLSFRNSLILPEEESPPQFYLPFATLPELRAVALSNFALLPSSLLEMLTCRRLVSVDMEKMKNVSGEVVVRLARERRDALECVRVYGDTLDEEAVAALAECPRLRTLHVMTCKTLPDASLRRVATLTRLTSLKLRHGYFSAPALLACFSESRFPHLVYLSLSRCLHVDMRVARAVRASAPALRELSFYLCPFIVSPNFDRSELEKLFPIQLLLD